MAIKYIALLLASSYLLQLAAADTNGFPAVPRSVIDVAGYWTFVQRQGFPSDGYLTGFTVYLQRNLASYPMTIGLYHPNSPGSCSFTVIKTWQLSGNSPGVLTVTLTGADVVPYKAGDSLGLTWYNTGNIPFDYVGAQNYCEDSVKVGAVGSTLPLVANRYGGRQYSLTTSYSATPPDPCTPNPCQNGGACTSGGTATATCNCAIGFSGSTCSTVVPDPCASSPCANGGACTRTSNTVFTCTCPAAYTGPSCQSIVDPCQSSPCKNGGVCTSSGTTATCTCTIGFSGANCNNVVPDPCASSPCANGGQCKRTSNSGFSCTCADGYAGATCTTQTGPCASSPCQNGGTCTNVGTTDYDCNCPDDYNDGDTCSTYQDPCSSSPCKNGGTCTRLSYINFSCACTAKFYSTFCELKINTQPCDNTPCQNGGTCTNTSPTTYSCQCTSAWEGQACQTVHCITGTASCPGLVYSRYALCGDCTKSVACKQKKQKLKTCNQSTVPYFDRKLRKCTTAKTACTGL